MNTEKNRHIAKGIVVIGAFLIGGFLAVAVTAPDLQRRAYEAGQKDGYWNGQAKGCAEQAIYDEWLEFRRADRKGESESVPEPTLWERP